MASSPRLLRSPRIPSPRTTLIPLDTKSDLTKPALASNEVSPLCSSVTISSCLQKAESRKQNVERARHTHYCARCWPCMSSSLVRLTLGHASSPGAVVLPMVTSIGPNSITCSAHSGQIPASRSPTRSSSGGLLEPKTRSFHRDCF